MFLGKHICMFRHTHIQIQFLKYEGDFTINAVHELVLFLNIIFGVFLCQDIGTGGYFNILLLQKILHVSKYFCGIDKYIDIPFHIGIDFAKMFPNLAVPIYIPSFCAQECPFILPTPAEIWILMLLILSTSWEGIFLCLIYIYFPDY